MDRSGKVRHQTPKIATFKRPTGLNEAQFSDDMLAAATSCNKTIIEGTADPIWGNGLDLNHPDAINPRKWKGRNAMGQLLEDVRSTISDVSSGSP